MHIKTAYRVPLWHLTAQDTVIIRADCNVPSAQGIILDDARLKALIPTMRQIIASEARIIIITHWGRPKTYDASLSTKHIVAWFNAHNIPMAFCASEGDIDNTPVIMLENIRFLDDTKAQALIHRLGSIGTYFVHDGFSVMHRDDIFNTELPLKFPHEKRSLGVSAYQEIINLDAFLQNIKKPALGIFGGAKLASKIDAIETLSQQLCTTIALLPAACFPVLRQSGIAIGKSYDDGTSPERIKTFKETVANNHCTLITPQDLLVAEKNTYTPPYTTVAVSKVQPEQIGISFGPITTTLLKKEIDSAHTIIINGFVGFLDQPASLEPFNNVLRHIAQTKPNATLIAGGDTYGALCKLGLAEKFPHYSLAGGATLDYCAGNKLPGLEVLL